MLVVYFHTLQAIDILDFFHQIIIQCFHTEQTENVMRVRLANDNGFTFFYPLTFEDDHMTPLGNQFLVMLTIILRDNQALLALGVLAKADNAGNFRQDGGFFRLACLEQIGNPGQTTGDVSRL